MIRLALIAWLALCGVANAQLSGGVGGFPGPGTPHSTALACCVLDGITTGIKTAYSTRRLLTAYAGNAMQVKRASDNATSNIGFVSDELDTATIATFCSGTTCQITIWNDQSGGANNLTPLGVSGPIIYAAGAVNTINSKPAGKYTSGSTMCLVNGTLSGNPVNTLFQNSVIRMASIGTTSAVSSGNANGTLEWRIVATTGNLELLKQAVASIGVSSAGITASNGAIVETQYESSGGAFSFWVNRVARGTGSSAQTLTAQTLVIGAGASNCSFEPFNGGGDAWMGEYIAYDLVGGIPSGSRTAIENNQSSYWGTP